jgi:hypothetical protein
MKFTVEQIQEYFWGWEFVSELENPTSPYPSLAALHNAFITLDCESDGIEAYFRRKEYYTKELNKN